jgi:hypothetical protein
MGSAEWTDEDDAEAEYGVWNNFALNDVLVEENKIRPLNVVEPIWPRWGDGVPNKLRRQIGTPYPYCYIKSVRHRYVAFFQTVELNWTNGQLISSLKNEGDLLPADQRSEWNGVYRVFLPDAVIDRCCGKDPTGTLYIGHGGSGESRSSTLRNRIGDLVTGTHHAISSRAHAATVQQKFPKDCLAVQWSFTDGDRVDWKGERAPESIIAEAFLLSCYQDCFGELPPWNEKL